jgi:hypothetical protein
MKKMQLWLMTPLALLLTVSSCTRNANERVKPDAANQRNQTEAVDKIEFAKVLAKALTNKDVRVLIRQEALKKFDNDHDILYQLSKDIKSASNKSLSDQIADYSQDAKVFSEMADKLDLLTIFVPTIKNFSPDTWDIDKQIPIVAVRDPLGKKKGEKMVAFDANGNQLQLDYATEPDRPVIVIKDNERVVIKNTNTASTARASDGNAPILRTADREYSFIDDAYDGRKKHEATTARLSVYANYDPLARYAYEKNITPQRDYIYYGIDPSQGVDSGPLKSNYAEFLTSLRINSYDSKNSIVDWSDGILEFRITFFFLATQGGVASVTKNIPVDATKLFVETTSPTPPYNVTTYTQEYLLPQPLEIANWDMQKYGDTWKILVMEYDPGTEVTYNTTMSSTFGTNFSVDVGAEIKIIKVGLKFGASSTTTKSESISIKVTEGADNLGETLLDYATPVINYRLHSDRGGYVLVPGVGRIPTNDAAEGYEVNTGVISLSIETRKRF